MPDLTIGTFTLGPFETNCYLLREAESDRCWIIDAGFDPQPLLGYIESEGLTPQAVMLTHAHADHIAGLGLVREAFPDVPIVGHTAESDWCQDPYSNLSATHGIPITVPGPTAFHEDDAEIEMAGRTWKVLFTPGHSPGGVTFWCEAEAVALVGDTLFAGSIGRHDFPHSNFDDLEASIRNRLYMLPGETQVLPGHGPITTIEREMRSNPFVRA